MIPQILSSSEIADLVRTNTPVNPKHVRLVTDEKGEAYLVIRRPNSVLAFPLTPNLDALSPLEVKEVMHEGCKELRAGRFTYLICEESGEVEVINALGKVISSYGVKGGKRWNPICGDGLCVLRSRKEFLALTPYFHHQIVKGLTPLTYCSNTEYYLDESAKVIVKLRNEILTPLNQLRPSKTSCIDSNSIAVLSGDDVFVVEGAATYRVFHGKPSRVIGGIHAVAIKSRDYWELISLESNERSTIRADECIFSSEGVLFCLRGSYLVSINPRVFLEGSVKCLKSFVTSRSYAAVQVTPWGPHHSLHVIGPVKPVAKIQSGNTLQTFLRPITLGWAGDVEVVVESPIYAYAGKISIISARPRLTNFKITECLASSNSSLKDCRGCNSIMEAEIKILKTFPEEYELLVEGKNIEIAEVKNLLVQSEGGIDSWRLRVKAKATQGFLRGGIGVLRFSAKTGEEVVELGSGVVEGNSCRLIPEPPSDIVVRRKGPSLKVSSTLKSSKLILICMNRRVEGVGSAEVDECVPPVVIEEIKEVPPFVWATKKLINITPTPKLLIGGKTYSASLKGMTLQIEVPVKEEVVTAMAPKVTAQGSNLHIKLSLRCVNPALIIWVCGMSSGIAPCLGDASVELTCNPLDVLGGITLYGALPATENIREILKVPSKECVEWLLIKGVLDAIRVSREVLIGET